jgi:hypothetical protein
LEQRIDFAPTDTVITGALAALSLNSEGLGFIGYLQKEDFELPDLKFAWQQFAWQQFKTYLPLILR